MIIRLREPTFHDTAVLVRLLNDPRVDRSHLSVPYPYTNYHAQSWIISSLESKSDHTRLICIGNDVVGQVSLKCDLNGDYYIGYWVGYDYSGIGVAKKSASMMLKFGFDEIELPLIYGGCADDNIASSKVLKSIGMTDTERYYDCLMPYGKVKLRRYEMTIDAFYVYHTIFCNKGL